MAITKEYNLKISTKQAQENIDELNKSLVAQEDLIEDIEGDLRKYEKQLGETTGREVARRSKLNEKIKETKNRLNEEKAGLKTINKERKRSNDQLKTATKNTADYGGVMGIIDSQTGGAISSITNLTTSVGGATKGFKLMRIAWMATGLGALVIAITSIATAFTNSEEGQNKFTKGMAQISAVIGNVTDILGNLGNAIMNVFSFNFDEAKKSLAAVTDGIKNFGEETRKEIKIAGELADMRAKTDKIERALVLERAEANRKFNELREKAADKENVAIAERIAALREAGRIDEEITKKEIEAARLRFEAKKAENALSESTKEDLDEEAALQARLIDLETARLKKAKTLTAEITTNLREAESERKANQSKIDAENKAIDAAEEKTRKEKEAKEIADAKSLAELKSQIRDAEAVNEEELKALEITKAEEHYNNLILLATQAGISTIDLEQAKTDKLNQIRSKGAEQIAKNEIYWESLTQREKTTIIAQGLNNLATILGKETAAGKAAAIASTTISTYQSATDSYKSLAGIPVIGPALGFAAAAAAVVSGITNVKKIISTKEPSIEGISIPSSGGGSVPSVPTQPAASTPPSFSSLGASVINQLADVLDIQNQQPIQAYVVSNDVTNAQSLERNIIEAASV